MCLKENNNNGYKTVWNVTLLTNGAAAFSSPAGRGPVWSSKIGDAHFQRHFWQTGHILLGGGIAHARAWWQQFVGVYKLWCNPITTMSSWRFGFSGMLLKQRKKKTSSFRFKDSSLFNATINSHCPTLILGKHITHLCPPPHPPRSEGRGGNVKGGGLFVWAESFWKGDAGGARWKMMKTDDYGTVKEAELCRHFELDM